MEDNIDISLEKPYCITYECKGSGELHVEDKANAGDKVTVEFVPYYYSKLSSLAVGGEIVDIANVTDNKYIFTMPETDV